MERSAKHNGAWNQVHNLYWLRIQIGAEYLLSQTRVTQQCTRSYPETNFCSSFANDYIFGINSSLGIQFLERHQFMKKFEEIFKNFF